MASDSGSTSGGVDARRPLKHLVAAPAALPNGIHYSLHAVPKGFAVELGMVLPSVSQEGLLIVPTFQKAAMDLVNIGPDVAKEKDDLLEKVRAGERGWVIVRGVLCDLVGRCPLV